MLAELQISNFVIIEHQVVTFTPGLNVISGETGAGKSILLHALELLRGAKPRAHAVRSGSDGLEVTALFRLDTVPAVVLDGLLDVARDQERKSQSDLDDAANTDALDLSGESEELVITRSVSATGKSKAFINGRLASVAMLEEAAGRLVSICGQSQHMRLLDPRYHLDLLDNFAKTLQLLSEYQLAYQQYRAADSAFANYATRRSMTQARLSEVTFLYEELKRAPLRLGARQELEDKIRRFSGGEKLIEYAARIEELVDADEGARIVIKKLSTDIAAMVRLDPGAKPIADAAERLNTELDELTMALKDYAVGIEIDPEALEALRDELGEVARLERKHKTTDLGLIQLRDKLEHELRGLEVESDDRILRLEAERTRGIALALAQQLSRERLQAAERLSSSVKLDLAELNMANAQVVFECVVSEMGPQGIDKGELMFTGNKGEALRPLRQIASGGELSRLTLVLKKLLQDDSGINVLVFDEVDTGISGGVARAVGKMLKELSATSQVLCITHLPQVASLADNNLVVEKQVVSDGSSQERTTSTVKNVTGEDRVNEIARMLSGFAVTEAGRESARELLSSNL